MDKNESVNEPEELEPEEPEELEPEEPEEELEPEEPELEPEEPEPILKDSSIQISPTDESNPVGQESDDPMLFIQLGDRVVFDSKNGRTIGTVYYRSLERISVKPDGVSNTLHDFEVEQTDEEELYTDVTAAYVIEKRKFESFVEQQDFRVNQMIDTFDNSGELYKSYKIIKVDKENDKIQIEDEDIHDIVFNFIGIESDEDFKVISIRQLVSDSENQDVFEEKKEDEEEEGEEENDEGDEIEILGSIEITQPKVYEEAAFFEQRIPDSIQKIDALNDFLSSIDPSLQKDPKAIRAVRILVETLFNLKQSTILYNDDGSIKGQKDISATTLAELIKRVYIPLGRPVLTVKKKLYDSADHKEDDDVYFEDFDHEQNDLSQKSSLVSSTMVGAPSGKIVREWNDQQTHLTKYLSPWSSTTGEPQWRAIHDTDFFRTAPPDLSDIDGKKVTAYIPLGDNETQFFCDKIPFGLERALETTYRKGTDRKKQVLLSEDSSTLDSYLLFPIRTANTLGTIRSSSLAMDSGRSQMPKMTMKNILEKIGAPTETGTSNDLVLLDVHGETLGNIPLADYIEGISVPALGLGGSFTTLEQYGMDTLELTPDIVNVLVTKIELYQSQLLTTIAKLREMIGGETEIEQNPFIVTNILEDIRSQPTLVEDLVEYERINPSLAESDIGKVAYLMRRHPDYFQAAVGNNPVLIAKALLVANNQTYIESLHITNILKYNELHSGDKPKPNMCKHVKDLVAVRRIQDDTERFKYLVEFFKRYQGPRDNNWINCNVCKEHLICIHERLQIQIYLNPAESNQKEIYLKFSGGQFQGKYICRNCGQAIKDIDFDNNVEFDDNGKPRATIVINDEFEEELTNLSNVPTSQQIELNEDELKCYNIVGEISSRLGIHLDNTGFKVVIDKSLSWLNRFLSRTEYNERKKKRPNLPDYDVAVARNVITASATFLLLEIQTKIPSYAVKHALVGCKSPGFDGYPLDPDATKKQGIEYIACAVSSINRNEAPWNQTGFQKVADGAKRQQGIIIYIENILKEIISDDVIQAELNEKRKYIEKDLQYTNDIIPASFLPEQIIITPEEAAKDIITPEVVANMGNKSKLVRLWIRQAHLLSKKTASLVRGSPVIETSCCLMSIEEPGTFWNDKDLPPLDKRTLVPNQQGQFLVTEFIPRASSTFVAEQDKELYYRIFLKCCFQGPRKGHSHEPGLTNSCPWCGFQFPTIPAIMDTDTEGKGALASQNIITGTNEFVDLLDTIHNVNIVESIKSMELTSITQIMEDFSMIQPVPIKDFKDILMVTTKNFLSLPPDADKGDIALAAGPISEVTAESEKVINDRITSESYKVLLEEIVQLSWVNFFQVLQNYFITPFQRMLSQFDRASLFIPIELQKELSNIHLKEDILPILDNDMALLSKGSLKDPKFNLAASKMEYFLKQMSAILAFKNKIRPIVVPGRDITLVYIQRALLYGPLATLINPSEIPDGTEMKSAVKSVGDPSLKYLLEIVALTLNKFNKERLTFSDQQLKEMIAIRNEKERSNIIAEYSKLTDEERAVELMNQRLGLGKYAVGGTKLIYAYDKDYYDLERQKRSAAGIIEFPGSKDEEGYEHNQHADDDFE